MNLNRTHVFTAAAVVALALLITGPINAMMRTRHNTSQFDHLDKERLNSLLEILRTQPLSLPVPPEIEQSKDQKVRDEYFAARRRIFEEHDAKISAAVEELAAMGDDIVDWLLREYRAPIKAPQHKIIVVLARIGTPKARDSLLNIATAPYSNSSQDAYAAWAARNYVKITNDKQDLLPLLKSNNPDVISVGLQQMPGVPVDDALLDLLRGYLQSTRYHPVINFAIRTKAASVLTGDGRSTLIEERVAAIVDSIHTVDDLPMANDRFQSDTTGTFADCTYSSLIEALARIQNATPFLLDAREKADGRPRAAIVVALARCGDPSVKGELCSILRDPNMVAMTNVRHQATRALGDIGTREDLPFLEQLFREDPLEIISFHGPIFEMVNGQYVNNTGSRMAPIREESDPAWKTARRWFPIRAAASQAIQAIKRRLPE
ncbi:MAG: HEAT repeat domain-containing protein [Solirubrobacterales bacterium]